MTSQRVLGVVLLIVGVILIAVGHNASHSIADQVTHAVNGRDTQTTIWYMVGGIAAAIIGLFLTIFGGGTRRSV